MTAPQFWCAGCQQHKNADQKSDVRKGNCFVCISCKAAHPKRPRATTGSKVTWLKPGSVTRVKPT